MGGCGAGSGVITSTNHFIVDHSGMRPESLALVRGQRSSKIIMRPIVVSVYPGERPILTDGRHRLQVARERGDATIQALIRTYDREGNTVSRVERTIKIQPR